MQEYGGCGGWNVQECGGWSEQVGGRCGWCIGPVPIKKSVTTVHCCKAGSVEG